MPSRAGCHEPLSFGADGSHVACDDRRRALIARVLRYFGAFSYRDAHFARRWSPEMSHPAHPAVDDHVALSVNVSGITPR